MKVLKYVFCRFDGRKLKLDFQIDLFLSVIHDFTAKLLKKTQLKSTSKNKTISTHKKPPTHNLLNQIALMLKQMKGDKREKIYNL